jgi:hypothetical protein
LEFIELEELDDQLVCAIGDGTEFAIGRIDLRGCRDGEGE